jgi:hypothetical protein
MRLGQKPGRQDDLTFHVRACLLKRRSRSRDDGVIAIATARILGGADTPGVELPTLASPQHRSIEQGDRARQFGASPNGPLDRRVETRRGRDTHAAEIEVLLEGP